MSGLLNNTGAVSGVIGTKTAPAIGTGTDGYVLTATGAGVNPAWEAVASATNTPNFMVSHSSTQSIDNSETAVHVQFDTEAIDSGGTFASGRFTPAVAGTYFISLTVGVENNTAAETEIVGCTIRKGTSVGATAALIPGAAARVDFRGNAARGAAITVTCLVVMDTDDFVQGWAFHKGSGGTALVTISNTMMSGFKLL